jgi:thiol-disulfide isomerase/thioredoxin
MIRGMPRFLHGSLACLGLAAWLSTGVAAAKDAVVGMLAPDFEVTGFDGTKYRLSDFRGQVLLINIWATWCGPCREELPLLDGYYLLRKDVGLRMIAVTTENSVPPAKLKPLAAVLQIPLAHYFHGKYGEVRYLPTSYIIDRDGILRYAQAGELKLDDLNRLLTPLLRQEPAGGG